MLHFNVIATVAVFKEQLVNLLKAQGPGMGPRSWPNTQAVCRIFVGQL